MSRTTQRNAPVLACLSRRDHCRITEAPMLAVRRQYAFPFILAVLLLLETSPAPAAEDKLSLKIRDAGKIEPIDVSVVGDMKPMPAFEVPPTVVAGDPRLFFVPTGFTWLCRADNPSTMAIRVDRVIAGVSACPTGSPSPTAIF